MKYALYLPNFGPFGEASLLAELAGEAEGAGWDGFFIWDHLVRSWAAPVVDPWVALSAIAMTTKSMRIGALVTPLARRRPWKVARETASLDRLSNGRLVLGVGLGSSGGVDVEWSHFGEELDLKKRGEMLDEGLEIIAGLWSGEPFSYQGRHYRVRESQFLPAPVQSPRIPVWVAGNWPHKLPFQRAARWDGMIPQVNKDEGDELGQLKQVVQYAQSLRADQPPLEIAYCHGRSPGDNAARAAEMVAPFVECGVTWWLEPLYPQYYGSDWRLDWPFDAMRERILQGPPR